MDFSSLLVIFAARFVLRDVAQPGSALRSGRRGRWFESSHPDFALQSFSDGGLFCLNRGIKYEVLKTGRVHKELWQA